MEAPQVVQVQAPEKSSVGLLVLGLVLIAAFIGLIGYLGYRYWWVPRQCTKLPADKKNHIDTFIWSSDAGQCVANTCSTGYGTSLTDNSPDPDGNCYIVYTEQFVGSTGDSGMCNTTGTKKTISSATSDTDCRNNCNADVTCKGYDWTSSSTAAGCNLYTAVTAPTTATASASSHCYSTST